MKRRLRCLLRRPIAALILAVTGMACLSGCGDDNNGIAEGYETLKSDALDKTPAMCPWREPEKDRVAFFPGADSSRLEPVILSSVRREIMQRLGDGAGPESNALYVNRIFQGKTPRGVIFTRRANGEFGAIEVVVATDNDGRIVGVRLQRHREPPEIAAALTDPAWLDAFKGKTDADAFQPGRDLPAVPPPPKSPPPPPPRPPAPC